MEPKSLEEAECWPKDTRAQIEIKNLAKRSSKTIEPLVEQAAEEIPLNAIEPSSASPELVKQEIEEEGESSAPVTTQPTIENPLGKFSSDDSSSSSPITCVPKNDPTAAEASTSADEKEKAVDSSTTEPMPKSNFEMLLRYVHARRHARPIKQKKHPEHLIALSVKTLREQQQQQQQQQQGAAEGSEEKKEPEKAKNVTISAYGVGYHKWNSSVQAKPMEYLSPLLSAPPATTSDEKKETCILFPKGKSNKTAPLPSGSRKQMNCFNRSICKPNQEKRRVTRIPRGLQITIIQELKEVKENIKQDEKTAEKVIVTEPRRSQEDSLDETPTKLICHGTISEAFMCLCGLLCCFKSLVCW
ncbi:uncharacterized protein LOC142983590 [Anticarsia gemmatalis]|uniref:uncharacterized protein LOC142983590 n=1 Tax=Anticarsia gemmatalis TaxID=129554 RepID=UPI003F765BB9